MRYQGKERACDRVPDLTGTRAGAPYTNERTIMYILILTLVISRTMPATMTTAEFTNKAACEDAAIAWKTQEKIVFGNALLTAICTPK